MRTGGILLASLLLMSCGNDGPAGPVGAAGSPGAAGAQGATGSPGAQGTAGGSGTPGSPGAAGDAGAPGAGLHAQWVDANGAAVKVLTSSLDTVTFLDASGHVWAYTTNDETVHPTLTNLRPVFTSGDCSGTAYWFALPPSFTFMMIGDATVHVRPPTQAMQTITVNSQTGIGGVGCSTLPGLTYHAIDPAGAQTVATTPTLAAPLRPVSLP